MAKRRLKLNPSDIRRMSGDVEEIIVGSGGNINLVYDERKRVAKEHVAAGNRWKEFSEIEEEVGLTGEQKGDFRAIRGIYNETRSILLKLDADIVRHGELHVRRMERRLKSLAEIPGTSVHQREIRNFSKRLFAFKARLKKMKPGDDIRDEIKSLYKELGSIEEAVSVWKAGKAEAMPSVRATKEAMSLPALWLDWARVRALATPYPELGDRISEIQGHLEGFRRASERGVPTQVAPQKVVYKPMTRQESRVIRTRIAGEIKELENWARTYGRKLKTYKQASQMLAAFVRVMGDYANGDVSGSGVDKLMRDLDRITTSLESHSMSSWGRSEQRDFGGKVTKVRKALVAMKKSGGKRRKQRERRKVAGNPTRVTAADKRFATAMLGNPPMEEKDKRRRRASKEEKHKEKKRQERGRRRRRASKEEKHKEKKGQEKSKKKVEGKSTNNPTRKKASPSDRLIRRCGKLWEHYCKRPGKERLKAVFEHLEVMKASTSKKVKAERTLCLRSANAEAKSLGMK
jgi:hypothetical protein